MREDGFEVATTVIPTEYGPLTLARAVVFDEKEARALRQPRRQAPAERERRRRAAPS
jgi:hypothetical protein